jgi:hypothetical protein
MPVTPGCVYYSLEPVSEGEYTTRTYGHPNRQMLEPLLVDI